MLSKLKIDFGFQKTAILGPFWRLRWDPKMDKLVPRSFLDRSKGDFWVLGECRKIHTKQRILGAIRALEASQGGLGSGVCEMRKLRFGCQNGNATQVGTTFWGRKGVRQWIAVVRPWSSGDGVNTHNYFEKNAKGASAGMKSWEICVGGPEEECIQHSLLHP